MIPTFTLDGPPEAPVLVLASSLGTTSALWEPQLPTLRQRFRVVRYELRGHGGTAAPPGPYGIDDLGGDVVELLDHLGVRTASLCGVSLGGMVGMWVAAHHPDRIDRLVLACTAPVLPPASAWHERAVAVRAGGTLQLLDALLGRWFTPAFDGRDVVAAMLGAADPEGYAGCCEAIAAMDQTADLGRIAAPTLVIAGADDPTTPPAMALGLQQAIAGAALVVLPNAAHLANLEQADAFTAAMVDHLAGRPAERGAAVRRAVLGDAHVDRPGRDESFVDLVTRYAWGEIWTRPGLDRRTRSCITLAMLVAQSRWEELPLHLRGALTNGLSRQEVTEVLLQSAIYCGVPGANTAFAIAQRTFEEP